MKLECQQLFEKNKQVQKKICTLLILVWRDITDPRKSEKNLLPSHKSFQMAPDNSRCPQMPPIGQVNSVTPLGNCIIHMTPAIAPQEAIQITSQLRHLPYEIV